MSSLKQACTANVYEVTATDLPLSCPMNNARVWDAHPRVYLPIETLGEVTCPYCNAHFVLKSGLKSSSDAPADVG